MNNTKASTTYLEINSLDRDTEQYDNPNEYRIQLYDQVKNVTRLSLIGGTIPVNSYNVVYPYNQFQAELSGSSIVDISLTPGEYTGSTLASELETRLTSGLGETFSVLYNDTNRKLTITNVSGGDYSFIFDEGKYSTKIDSHSKAIKKRNNASQLLGFYGRDSVTSSSDVLISTNPIVLCPIRRVYLYLNANHSASLTNLKQSGQKRQPFAILYLNVANNTCDQVYLDRDSINFYSQTYGGQDLRYFDLEFRDEFGNKYDFQGRDHTLLFEIVVNTPSITPNLPPPMTYPAQMNARDIAIQQLFQKP
jgi:hypothetical protein